jgi:hypothetical protein
MTYDPADPPMMGCGHAANGVKGRLSDPDAKPCCVICAGLHPGADVIVEKPDLSGRMARCTYYGTYPRPLGGRQCQSERPSDSPGLAFFEHQPDKPFDRYFCGCWGFD